MYNKIYEYNENFFKKINTYEKAYWLGFIMADGYVFRRNDKSNHTGVRIRLSVKDKSHLEKLNEDISSNKPIKVVKNYGIYKNSNDLAEFYIPSIKLVNDLNNLGFINGNKTGKEFLIKFEDNNYTKNFILGLFDGDGCVLSYQSYSKRDNKYRTLYEWQIVSSKQILEEIQEFLLSQICDLKFQKISKNSNKKNNKLYRLRIGNRNSIKSIYEYLYLDKCSNSILQRKYSIFKEIYENLSKLT